MPRSADPTRRSILDRAVDLGSADGLVDLSIGRLASEIGLSKSGLFAHFGSKTDLQLAVIDHAAERFERQVLAAARDAAPGLARLRALLEAWIASIESTGNRGGCFFDAVSSEFASRPGPVRDRLARLSFGWRAQLEEQGSIAQRCGELVPGCDPAALAFRLHAYVAEANWARELLDESDAFDRARAAAQATLESVTAEPPSEGGSR